MYLIIFPAHNISSVSVVYYIYVYIFASSLFVIVANNCCTRICAIAFDRLAVALNNTS